MTGPYTEDTAQDALGTIRPDTPIVLQWHDTGDTGHTRDFKTPEEAKEFLGNKEV